MCGRYDISDSAAQMALLFNLGLTGDTLPAGEIAPTAAGAVVALGADGTRKAVVMRWGLEPGWMREPPSRPIFNARSETVEDKPMFRTAFAKRRALAPASAFYEWQGEPGAKTRYRFTRPDGSPMVFAGLWEKRKLDSGELKLTYTILTCAANGDVADYHDRMPVILGPDQWDVWLNAESPLPVIKDMLQPAPDGYLEAAKG
ncbi:SOS response-associated peptidase [Hyphobacterium marinum]|uniref:Abasic site processing protein n=1 Tax=Hyphobacterium marinum TaxID=3116574 RepID=A0ABU7M0T5_9PROT|nr:SOS response-associated peptidase [Hyphobacterium sp. Y6023]MEE2567414.1 SOS response-associated peptidase [Hyphobacterium sp. Y6023]